VQDDPYYEKIKRAIDLLLSTAAIILLLPVWLLIALLIRLDLPGPIFYKHRRLGKHRKIFYLWKFRTMIHNADAWIENHPDLKEEFKKKIKLENDPRVTRLGNILRKTSIDELPQLINVLKGEMSLVGPRPKLLMEAENYGNVLDTILSVPPGITGLWQVSGRSKLPYQKRIELDMHYIDHRSVWLDLKILLKTIPAVIKGEGAV